jgi:hypothetical protein
LQSGVILPESKLAVKDWQERQKANKAGDDAISSILSLFHLAIPAFDAFPFASNLDVQANIVHAFSVVHKFVIAHTASVGPVRRKEL